MVFDMLLTDSVTLIKRDGTTVEDVKASVQAGKIFIQGHELLIESGDIVQRKMSNGTEENFEVIDPGFHEKFHDIPARYEMGVRKLGVPEARNAIQSITYNVTGNNARINQNSVDRSINVVQVNADVIDNIEALRQEIIRFVADEMRRSEALDVVDAIERQFKSASLKKSVIRALLQGLPSVGNIASIGSFLLSLVD